MKNWISISLGAVMAALPLMAHATDVTLIPTTPEWAADEFATTSYVKGAYNALGEFINTKQDKFTADGNALQTTVATSTTKAATAENASDNKLISEKAVLTAIEAVQSGATDSTDAINELIGDEELTTEAGTLTGAINELNGAISDETTRATTAEDGLQDAIDAEVTRATTAEDGLQAQIDTLKNKQIKYVSSWSNPVTIIKKIAELPDAAPAAGSGGSGSGTSGTGTGTGTGTGSGTDDTGAGAGGADTGGEGGE